MDFISKWKLLIAIVIIFLSFILGFISKIMTLEAVANINKSNKHQLYFIFWIIVYLVSWLLVFFGIFLIGKRAYDEIQNHIKKKIKKGYTKVVKKPVKEHLHKPVKKFIKKARNQSKATYEKIKINFL